MQVVVGNGSMVFVLNLSKPAFQSDSLIVVRTVGNAFSGVPLSRFCGLFSNGVQQSDC